MTSEETFTCFIRPVPLATLFQNSDETTAYNSGSQFHWKTLQITTACTGIPSVSLPGQFTDALKIKQAHYPCKHHKVYACLFTRQKEKSSLTKLALVCFKKYLSECLIQPPLQPMGRNIQEPINLVILYVVPVLDLPELYKRNALQLCRSHDYRVLDYTPPKKKLRACST